MRVFLFTTIVLLSSWAFSSELYQVSVKSSYQSQKASKEKLILKEGQALSFTDASETKIEIVVTKYEVDNVQLAFVVSRDNGSGESTVVSAPKIVTPLNETADIETLTESGEKISLTVDVKKL